MIPAENFYFAAMKAASVQEIKLKLKEISPAELADLCLTLARYKKDNKEFLTYLLFEADDEAAYIRQVKEEMDESFAQINTSQLYFVRKSLRKILRTINKYIRYTGSRTAETELLLHYCLSFRGLRLPLNKSVVLANLYQAQIKKLEKAISTMHEDLQYDYLKELARLQ